MAKYTPYAYAALPATGIDVNGIYYIPDPANPDVFNSFIRNNANSAWLSQGPVDAVTAVNGFIGAVEIDLEWNAATGVLTMTGGTVSVDLDSRYRKNADDVPWADVSGAPAFALNNQVVHNTGAETVAGVKTFSSNVIVPAATGASQAVNKGQMDAADGVLQTQINNLSAAVTDGMRVPSDIDLSTNPNYPASEKGDGYVVTVAGRIGGPSGPQLRVGAEIRCKINSASGTHAAVGDNFYILESDLDQATESVPGFAKIATAAVAAAGTNDTDIMTPLKTQQKLNTADTANNAKFVRADAAQSFSAGQKTQARGNIGAADDSTVVHKTGAESINDVKTFTAIPILPIAAPTADAQAANRKFVVDTTAAAVAWGGTNGKEW